MGLVGKEGWETGPIGHGKQVGRLVDTVGYMPAGTNQWQAAGKH